MNKLLVFIIQLYGRTTYTVQAKGNDMPLSVNSQIGRKVGHLHLRFLAIIR